MNKKYQRIAVSILLVVSLILSMPGTARAKAKVKLNKTRISVTIGSTVELLVKNTTKKVKWSSSNKKVASVNSYGEVTGKKAGAAKVTAKVGKKKLTCNVTVPSQNISNKSIYIKVGEKQKLELYGVAGDDSVFWGSDYERIATVTQSGEITAKSIGTTNVYAVINSGIGKTYTCEVIVYDRSSSGDIITATPRPVWTPTPTASPSPTPRPTATPKPAYIPVTKVVLSQRSMSLTAGRTNRLTATLIPSDATNKGLRWTSANTNVATVKADGTVTGLNAGSTVVYVTTSDGEYIAICTVTVTGSISPSPSPSVRPSASPSPRPSVSPSPSPSVVPVTKVTLPQKELTLTAGTTYPMKATVVPNNATNKNVKWSSADESIAKIDNNGKLTLLAAGNTVVFVTTEEGEFVAVCRIKVNGGSTATPTPTPTPTPIPLTLNAKSLALYEKQNSTLTVSGASGTVTWTSNDDTVASVGGDGTVTAVKAGKATITAAEGERKATCDVTVQANVDAVLTMDGNKVTGCSNAADATRVEIPANVTEIAEGAFKDAAKLWSVTLPDSITAIGTEAFSGCTALESIAIPAGVTEIPAKAFADCTSLKSIRLPSSVTTIADDAFVNCKNYTICGEGGSVAEQWAKDHNIPFKEEEKEEQGT